LKTHRNLFKCTGFILGLIILLTLLSYFFHRKDGAYVYNSLAVNLKIDDIRTEPENSLDVFFLGDSETYAAFYPQHLYSKYGYSSYVCGTSGQRICDTYAILKEIFQIQKPQVIVLETNCLYRKIEQPNENSDLVMNLLRDNFPIIANHTDWKRRARKLLPKGWEENRRKFKGFIKRNKKTPYTNGKYMKKTKKKCTISKENSSYLKQLSDLCQKNNAELLLVSTPSPKNWNYKKHNGVAAWAKAHNAAYIDLNLEKELAINWKTDTLDGGDHMNLSGAKKVTNFMGEYFRANYTLTDHRNDSVHQN